MSFQRSMGSAVGDERTLVVFNYGNTAATAHVSNLGGASTLRSLWAAGAGNANITAGAAALNVAAKSVSVFSIE
jgi:hypothetical protein